jgi:hypothetical protein
MVEPGVDAWACTSERRVRSWAAMRHGLALISLLIVMTAVTATASAAKVRTLQLGSTFVVTGQTGSLPGKSVRATGTVVVVKSWDAGTSRLITTARTDSHGSYQVAIKLTRRGLLTLRITPPDKHDVRYLIRVV